MTEWVWNRFETIAAARGRAVAAWFGDESLTFSQLKTRAEGLTAAISLRPGDRVIIRGENSLALISLVLAVWRQGGIVTMVHADAPLRHLQHAAQTAAPVLVFCDNPEEATDLEARSITMPEGELGLCNPAAALELDAIASIIFTSGSSGLPKGVTQSSYNLVNGAARVRDMLGLEPTDAILCPIPFAFDYGWGQLMSLLLEGIPLVLPSPRNSFGLCEAISEYQPTVLAGVPAVFADLLSGLSPIRDIDRRSIRLITNTGSKIPASVWAQLLEVFPDTPISLNYGLTETYRSAALPVELAREHPDSVGFAIEGVTLSVLREDGSEAAPGEIGEIIHHGAGTFSGYWNNKEGTQEVLRTLDSSNESVVFTGDLGWIDESGMLFIKGRKDRQLKSMGVRVSPDEIEKIIYESGLVTEVAIISRPHDVLGDMIVACIVLPSDKEPRPLQKTLKKFIRANMSNFMQPRQYIVMESLPRTPSGKVAYSELNTLAQSE